MKAFDIYDTPDTYEGFVRSVKKLIEETEVSSEEDYYPDALFTVDKMDLGRIIDLDELTFKYEDLSQDDICHSLGVKHLMQDDIKWYAHVSYVPDFANDIEYLLLITGSKMKTNIYVNQIFYEDNQAEIEDWVEANPINPSFESKVVPLRRAIVNRG